MLPKIHQPVYKGGKRMKYAHQSKHQTGQVIKPQLTSLIDVMTILLVFLMINFSVAGNIITSSKDLRLPVSSSSETPEMINSIEISSSAIIANGHVISAIATMHADSIIVAELMHWLSQHPSLLSTGELLVQADRHVPFEILKKVMVTCNKAGCNNFTFLVQQDK